MPAVSAMAASVEASLNLKDAVNAASKTTVTIVSFANWVLFWGLEDFKSGATYRVHGIKRDRQNIIWK